MIQSATLKRSLRIIFKDYPLQAPFIFLLMVFAAITEGLNMAMIIPLLSLLGVQSGDSSALEEHLRTAFNFIGLEMNMTSILTLFVGITFTQASFFILQGWLTSKLQNELVKKWRMELFDGCLHASWKYITQNKSGDFVNAVVNEVGRAGLGILAIFQFIPSLAVTAVYLCLCFFASWQTALALMGLGAVAFGATRWLLVRARHNGQKYVAAHEVITAFAGEVFSGMKTIKANAAEELVFDQVEAESENIRYLATINTFDPYLIKAIFEGLGIVFLAGFLVLGTAYLNVPLEAILLIIASFVRLYPRLMQMQQSKQSMSILFPSVAKVLDLIDEARDEKQDLGKGKYQLSEQDKSDISVKDLSLSYGEHIILNKLNIHFEGYKTMALVGASGSGKTTLVDCILGLSHAQDGVIEIAGQKLDELDLASWRRQVGYVGQETFLFNASIKENLKFGNPQASEEDILSAAKAAHANDFIDALESGYDTVVGDFGVRLSGGQRQRLGLARALVGEKKLLILDEATSALDSKSEKHVIEAISSLQGKVTIIAIAHRLSTVRNADKIFVLNKGELVEMGTWAELENKNGMFKEFLLHQQA